MQRVLAAVWRRLPQSARRTLERFPPVRALIALVAPPPVYEPGVQAALAALVEPGWRCVDVGAHEGVLTSLLAHLVGPNGSVIAFEAHATNSARLRKRIARTPFASRVTVENLAVTDGAAERVWLHPGRGRASAEWNVVGTDLEGRATARAIEVQATSLDAYFPPGERAPDLVKIDVEGAEAQVLAGMRRLLREVRPALLVEFHNEAGWAGRHELLEAKYHLYALDGARLDSARDGARVYHCLALAQEQSLPQSFGVSRSGVGRE